MIKSNHRSIFNLALILSILCFLSLLSSCSSPANYDKEPFEISGTITDANDGSVIADATLKLLGIDLLQEKRSDKDGKYHFTHHGGCTDNDDANIKGVRIEASKSGYISKTTWIRCSPRVHTIDFQLVPEED